MAPSDIKKLEAWAKQHGVNRSQIMYDAMRSLDGSIMDELGSLRAELADQIATTERMEALVNSLKDEMSRLQSSQNLVDAITSPYQSPDAKLTKQEQEKRRTLRAVLINPENLRHLELLAMGELERPPLPIFTDMLRAWGSWEAALQAAAAAKQTTKENQK